MKYIGLLFILLPLGVLGQSSSQFCSRSHLHNADLRTIIDDFRSDSLDIVHTFIRLDMSDMSNSYISAHTTVTVVPLVSGIASIQFDLEGLTVDSVLGENVAAFEDLGAQIKLTFSSELVIGDTFNIEFYYQGNPIKDASGWGGFYFSGEFAWNLGVGFAADPHSYGRVWFPCFDNFIERSTFEYLVETPLGRVASCNGLLVSSDTALSGNPRFHFLLSQPIPSYLACVAVGAYEVLSSNYNGIESEFPVELYARATDTTKLKASFIHLNDAIAAFESAYGPYRFEKVGYSLVPFNAGAMEHATNITYPIYAANGTLGNESLMSHELAHMWWGDNVTCQTDGDMWLNEGWASFSEFVFDEHVYGREAYETSLLVDLRYMLQFGHHFEEGYRPVAGQPHEYVYGDHVYKKGALVAHNLRGYLGDEDFFAGVSAFMDEFQFQPVSSDSLERFMSEFTEKDLGPFFRDWVHAPGWNVVVVDSHKFSGNELKVFLQQKLKGTDTYHTDVPVYLSFYDQDGNRVESLVKMSGKYQEVTVPLAFDPAWIVVNEGNQIAWASTADQMEITDPGVMDLKNMYWNVTVDEVNVPAKVRFQQVWSYPDPIKDWSTKAFKLNDNRYWIVDGIGIDQIEMSGWFFYDGRSSGASGYLDISLLAQTEDSLILLYRASSKDDWEEYGYYTKNVLGLSNNGVGIIEMQKILKGEYTLANRDPAVLSANLTKDQGLRLFPNPTEGAIYLNDPNRAVNEIRIYSTDGKLISTQQNVGDLGVFNLKGIAAQIIVFELIGKNNKVLEKGKLVYKPN